MVDGVKLENFKKQTSNQKLAINNNNNKLCNITYSNYKNSGNKIRICYNFCNHVNILLYWLVKGSNKP